jgi:hypothetical protein
MFYLFNKVRLKPDTNYVTRSDQIVVSGSAYLPQLSDEEIEQLSWKVGRRIFVCASYAELISKNFEGDENKFLVYLMEYPSDRSLEVHLNNSDLFGLLVKWYKTILPNLSSEQAYSFFQLSYRRVANQSLAFQQPHVEMGSCSTAVCQQLFNSLPDYAAFTEKWDTVKTFDLTETQQQWLHENAALEFRLATYYCTDNETFKQALDARVKQIVLKSHVSALCDVKKKVLQSFFSRFNFLFGGEAGLARETFDDIQTWVLKSPKYKFVLDQNFKPENLSYIQNTYDLDDLRQVYWRETKVDVGQTLQEFVEQSHFLDPEITLDDVINFELTSQFNRLFLGTREYNLTINVYLLELMLDWIRSGDIDKLTNYSLFKPD